MKAVLVLLASLGLLATSVATASAATVNEASSPTSTTQQVVPYVVRNADGSLIGPGGNVQCQQVGTFDYATDRTDYDPVDPGENFTVLIKDSLGQIVGTADVAYNPTTKLLSFVGTIPIEAVIVKGGNDANVYDYRPAGVMTDTGLGAPINASGGVAGLSNITMCSNPHDDPPPSNWCSPGYWRNHLEAWAPTGISPTERYGSYYQLTTLSKKAPSGSNPTLIDVLKAPQTYGGAAFNNVGDLLSDHHPGVNWAPGDERTEDSCPLS